MPEAVRSRDRSWPIIAAQFHAEQKDFTTPGPDDPPESVAALLTDTERLPDYADPDLLDHGSAPFYTVPPAVHLISLSAGALIRVYESPSIAAVLATTGREQSNAPHTRSNAVMLPLPRLASMPTPCAGVPKNAFCL